MIALGHSNTNMDQEIAKEIEGVDLVINGYKNQYFWNGRSMIDELSVISNLTTQTQQSGKEVPVFQSVAYGKYLGKLKIKFDANGNLEDVQISPILLDETIPQDPDSVALVQKYSNDVAARSTEVVGNTAVVLDGDACATEECNLGNLIADAMVYYHALGFEGERWTDAPIAMIHSGAIADSIAPGNRPAAVTRGDLMSALPTESNVALVTVSGTVLNQILEHAVADYSIRNPTGQFLHFSGVRVVYDLAQEPGSRVVSAVVRCHNCYLPTFYVIDSWRDYPILMPAALANSEYGFEMLRGQPRVDFEYDELTSVAEFIRLRSPVYPEVSGRISLLNIDSLDDASVSLTSTCTMTFLAAISASFSLVQ